MPIISPLLAGRGQDIHVGFDIRGDSKSRLYGGRSCRLTGVGDVRD